MRNVGRMVKMGTLGWYVDALEQFLQETTDGIAAPQQNVKEQENMDTREVIIWTQENCPLCQKVKDLFGEGNYVEKQAADLLGGSIPDADAMAQLAMQDMQLPLVQVDGEWQEVTALLRKHDISAA